MKKPDFLQQVHLDILELYRVEGASCGFTLQVLTDVGLSREQAVDAMKYFIDELSASPRGKAILASNQRAGERRVWALICYLFALALVIFALMHSPGGIVTGWVLLPFLAGCGIFLAGFVSEGLSYLD